MQRIIQLFLKAFGLKIIKIKAVNVKIRDLNVPPHIKPPSNLNPINSKKLIDFFWQKNEEHLKFSLGERLCIIRSRAAFRFVKNEMEVVGLLEKYNFKAVYMGDYTLSQKVSMVYSAKHFGGIIGATFGFLYFMRRKTNIFEFRMKNVGVYIILLPKNLY